MSNTKMKAIKKVTEQHAFNELRLREYFLSAVKAIKMLARTQNQYRCKHFCIDLRIVYSLFSTS